MTTHNCRSCGAKVGEPHVGYCSVSRCMWTGRQRMTCDGGFADIVRQLRADGHDDMADRLAYHLSIEDEDHECGDDVWAGRWPGEADCERLGWWCVGPPWKSVPAGTEGATHDLNRLALQGTWNRDKQRWEGPE